MKNLVRSFLGTLLVTALVVLVGCIELPTEYRVVTISNFCNFNNDTLFTFDGVPMHLDTIACSGLVDTTTVTP